MAEQTPDSIITTQRNGQTIVAELFFNHSSTETFRDKLLKGELRQRLSWKRWKVRSRQYRDGLTASNAVNWSIRCLPAV